MLVIEKKSCADLGLERGGGRRGPRHPFPCKNWWFFFSISHSKVPKIGIKPHPTPTIPGKHNFPSDPPPLRKKFFWIRAWERSSPLEMRWFHPPLLADIQPGIGLWNVTTKYYKTMLFAWFVLGFFFYTLLQSISNFNGFCSTSHAIVPHVIFVFVLKIQKPVFVWFLHEKFMQSKYRSF